MSVTHPPEAEKAPSTPRQLKWRDPDTLRTVVFVLIGAAAGWYLLLQLAPVLRPLLIAAFLAYVLMPYHSRLRYQVGTPASLVILAGSTAGILVVFAFITYASLLELKDLLPTLQKRGSELSEHVEHAIASHAPWVVPGDDSKPTQTRINEQLAIFFSSVLSLSANAALEACVVALYLLFLLLEGSRLPDRIRNAYEPARADEILQIAGQVNAAVVSYLKAKVKSSLLLAVPVGLILWVVGVKFALLWLVLTFLCNFIPYIGTVIAYSLPVAFAFLLFDLRWEPFVAAGLLLAWHITSASVFEPMIIGNAVGVSPLVILGSLAFWGLLWGIPGMFLAIPLTVVAILVMDHFEQTRSIARLLRGG